MHNFYTVKKLESKFIRGGVSRVVSLYIFLWNERMYKKVAIRKWLVGHLVLSY